jgi:hypothetical protein
MSGQVSIWWMYAGTIALFLLASEGGFRLGRRLRKPAAADGGGTALGGLLALLGLLLAFTFGMASARYDGRKQMLLDEANAIGTAYLRADLLPEPGRGEVRDLLRAYVDLRLEVARSGKVQEGIASSERIHGELWSRATGHAAREPNPIAALFVQAVNDVIDMHGKRVALAWRNPIPPTILYTLYVVAVLAVVAMGFDGGLRGVRGLVPTGAVVITLATVVALIVDLDRPGEGLLQVSQQAMAELRASMGR